MKQRLIKVRLVIKIPNPRKVVLKDHTGLTATKYQIVNKSKMV